MKTISLITGILGIILSLIGTILMLNELKINVSALRHREPDAEKYTGYDAYKNSLKQVEDAIKHTNEERRVQSILENKYVIMIILGSILQGISLAASFSIP